ncbi:uncharacterized protein LOC120641782 [Panicum virgatum]|uniref:Uncharacterized protein n=1 Tax=Panicum virgatum TaxID=38727 RepID=A0A8T0QPL6_PANVG|nr:uncharacterized protein LOC120641782 [Panicum virgatum]KAG2574724.1 hypothetical protein PVAP13_7KG341700 [Panicum virgatum]
MLSAQRTRSVENSLWQFVVVVEAPPKASGSKLSKSRRPRPSYRCLACQWIVVGQSIATLRYHFEHAKSRKACTGITQHLINRLNALGGFKVAKVYPTTATLMARGNKKRKQLSQASVSAPFMPSVDTAGGVGTVGGISQKVEAARAICSSVMDLVASDASDTDRNKIVEKLREQDAILQELKSICMKAPPEFSSAPSKELSPASQLPVLSSKASAPSKDLSLASQLSVPISSKASAPSQELSPASQLYFSISSKASAPSKDLSSAPQLPLPMSSKASGIFSGLEDLFPEENFDEAENMKYRQNICLQTIPEEQLDQLYAELPPSPSTQS